MLPGVDAANYGIENLRRSINDIRRWMKALLDGLPSCNFDRVLIGDSSCIDAIHVNPVSMVVGRRGAGHHVKRSRRHVGLGMTRRFPVALDAH